MVAAVLALQLSGSAVAACPEAIEDVVFLPVDGADNVPVEARLTAIVYGDAENAEVALFGDGKPIPGTTEHRLWRDEAHEHGGALIFTPDDPLDANAEYTWGVRYDKTQVAEAGFQASSEVVRPLAGTSVPLIENVEVSDVFMSTNACGEERAVREVTMDVWPTEEDKLGLSILEVYLYGSEFEAVSQNTIYTTLVVPAVKEPQTVSLEVFARVAPTHSVSARQYNGVGEDSAAAVAHLIDDYLGEEPPDDGGCGCTSSSPRAATALPLVLFGLLVGRRRQRVRSTYCRDHPC